MSDQGALVSAHLSRYDALLRISRTLAQHRTITELFDVLAEELHPRIPFDVCRETPSASHPSVQ